MTTCPWIGDSNDLIDAPFPNTLLTQVSGNNNREELVGDVLFNDFRRVEFVAAARACGDARPTSADLDK